MDPYGHHNRKILSPLDKKRDEQSIEKKDEPVKKSEAVVEKVEDNPALVEHLSDLRKQIIKSVVVFIFFFIAVFASINWWFPYVTRGHDLIILSPLEVVKFYMSISTVLAIGLSLPFLCHFIWQFVKPGLNEQEGKFFGFYSPIMLVLFVIGISFGYFVVNPLSYNFLTSLGAVNFEVMVSAQEYANFLLLTTFPLGLLFELPIVALFLATIGILTSESMKKVRKWSYVSLAVLSALITPPDFISQLIVLVPMIGLYEASIRIVNYREQKNLSVNEVQ